MILPSLWLWDKNLFMDLFLFLEYWTVTTLHLLFNTSVRDLEEVFVIPFLVSDCMDWSQGQFYQIFKIEVSHAKVNDKGNPI